MIRSQVIRAGAALAMMAGSAVTLGPSMATAHAASKPPARVGFYQYQGYLTAAPASTAAPATLTIQTEHRGLITVAVGPSTRIVRRYYGASGLDELSANDVLQVRGTTTAPGAVAATEIRDLSIQAAFTRLVGKVTAVGASSISVVVQRDVYRRAPFIPGQNITLPVGPSTQVISGTTTTTGSTAAIAVGDRVTALGVFNRVGQTFRSTFRIRILR